MPSFDCQRCGACCVNPPENRREGFLDYIEVDAAAPLLLQPKLVARLVRYNADGVPHLRLTPGEGRCQALRGKLGARVTCTIYRERPQACRKVEAGSRLCQRYRRAAGLD